MHTYTNLYDLLLPPDIKGLTIRIPVLMRFPINTNGCQFQSPVGIKKCDKILLKSTIDVAKCNSYYKMWQYTRHATLCNLICILVGA